MVDKIGDYGSSLFDALALTKDVGANPRRIPKIFQSEDMRRDDIVAAKDVIVSAATSTKIKEDRTVSNVGRRNESGVSKINQFPKDVLNRIRELFPAKNRETSLIAFVIHHLGEGLEIGDYRAPHDVAQLVKENQKTDRVNEALKLLSDKMDKLSNQATLLQHMAAYATLHDLGIRKRTDSVFDMDVLEDPIFTLTEKFMESFPEYKEIVNARGSRNTNYYKKDRKERVKL